MFECALCDVKLTAKTRSKEHIILNSLGGRRVTTKFLCVDCNMTSGHKWDAKLSRELNPLSILFDISRQSGETPSEEFETVSGSKIKLGPEGLSTIKPTIILSPNSLGTHISVSARNQAVARQVLRGLQRKIAGIDVDAAIQKAERSYRPFSDPIKFSIQIDAPTMGRSMVKSALALAVSGGAPSSKCIEAIRFLKDQADPCFGYYYQTDLLSSRPEKTVLHCVAAHSTADGLLLGYVELFSTFRIVACLSSTYVGPPIDTTYAIDPIAGTELPIKVNLNFSGSEIRDIYDHKMIPDGAIAAALDRAMPLAVERSLMKERRIAISEAMKSAWGRLDAQPGSILDAVQLASLFRDFANEMTPFILHFAAQEPPASGDESTHKSFKQDE